MSFARSGAQDTVVILFAMGPCFTRSGGMLSVTRYLAEARKPLDQFLKRAWIIGTG